jgi:cation-transporting P-type ATPase 13A2
MFRNHGLTLESEIEMAEKKSSNSSPTLGVVKRFEFSSALQRMSTISVNHDKNLFTAYVKGSPEMIESLSLKETIPHNYFSVLEKYTEDGLRVLALGYKQIHNIDAKWIDECKREDIE